MANRETFFHRVAQALQARANCETKAQAGDSLEHFSAMARHWSDYLEWIVKETAPSGSGFDNGTTLDFDASTPQRLVFLTSFHHMNENGFYTGWTEHTVIVTADLLGLNVRVTGRDRAQIKDYIAEQFSNLDNPELEVATLADYRNMLAAQNGQNKALPL